MKKLYNKNLDSKGFTLIELFVVILIIWILACNAKPNHYKKPNPNKEYQLECFKNQRYLQEAAEMYNMDNAEILDTAFPGEEFEAYHKLLVQKKYLNNYITPRNNICSYGFVDLMGSGSVFCKIHGTIDSKDFDAPIYPEVDSLSEKPYCEYYKNLIDQMRNESRKIRKRIQNKMNLEYLLLEEPMVPSFLLLMTLAYSAFSWLKSKKKS